MLSSGTVQLLKVEEEVEFITQMGYPGYFLTIIGIWKVFGVVAVLTPRFPVLKEWAYAGFFFVTSGAAFSHIASGTLNDIFPSLLLLALTLISWYFRPDKKILKLSEQLVTS